jgi:hypothetical protein
MEWSVLDTQNVASLLKWSLLQKNKKQETDVREATYAQVFS